MASLRNRLIAGLIALIMALFVLAAVFMSNAELRRGCMPSFLSGIAGVRVHGRVLIASSWDSELPYVRLLVRKSDGACVVVIVNSSTKAEMPNIELHRYEGMKCDAAGLMWPGLGDKPAELIAAKVVVTK